MLAAALETGNRRVFVEYDSHGPNWVLENPLEVAFPNYSTNRLLAVD